MNEEKGAVLFGELLHEDTLARRLWWRRAQKHDLSRFFHRCLEVLQAEQLAFELVEGQGWVRIPPSVSPRSSSAARLSACATSSASSWGSDHTRHDHGRAAQQPVSETPEARPARGLPGTS
jgi:hypothetical protein